MDGIQWDLTTLDGKMLSVYNIDNSDLHQVAKQKVAGMQITNLEQE